MTDASRRQGQATIERLCRLAGVSRAGFYRHWQASAPRAEETGVRDALQRAALENRRYGYRRLTAQLKREGWAVNHKRVLRLMREDNLLCLPRRPFVPVTTDSRHDWRIVPNLARGLDLTGLDQLWVAEPLGNAEGGKSPTCACMRSSPTSRSCWMPSAAVSWAGHWSPICARNWRWRRSTWR